MPKTSDRRLLELEDQIKYLLKGSKKTPKTNLTQPPQAYASAVYLKLQQRELEPSFVARVQSYMEAHTERMEREEISKAVTKYVNAISLIRIEDDRDKECDEVIDKKVIEQSEVSKEEDIKEDVENNDSDRSMNKDSTRWGMYVDRLIEMPRS
ncbi:hypothetical protein Tco_1132773 [Tanacetum coccineum]|uniref:Uncharacterized protein n=1 Tax=Tanacetum coccineum TaxID=301880 RepID=A0ABQ5JCV3_9ASTR